jgi:apolipoprotein D and lipocalin family protein
MRRWMLGALLMLAACGREVAEAPPGEAMSFRDRTVPIGATTRGSPGDLNGGWVVSASFGEGPVRGLDVTDRVRVELDAAGRGDWTFTDRAGAWVRVPVGLAQPGRYEVRAPQPPARVLFGTEAPKFVVLWADDDFRTAVVGTPDGSFGWVMDRPGQGSPDRMAAAREVLDFNGYEVGRLSDRPEAPPVPII